MNDRGQAKQQAIRGLFVVLIFAGLMFMTQLNFGSDGDDQEALSTLRHSWYDWLFGKLENDPSFNWNHEALPSEVVRRQQLMQLHKPQVTIVTAWYPGEAVSEESKHWITSFLTLRANLYVFTSPQQLNFLQATRLTAFPLGRTHWNTGFDSPLQFPVFNDERGLVLSPADWAAQLQLGESEHGIRRSEQQLAFALGKVWMMKHASEHNPLRTQYFHWQDIDSFRNINEQFVDLQQQLHHWPDSQRLESVVRQLTARGTPRLWFPIIAPVPRPPPQPSIREAAQLRANVVMGSSFFGEAGAIGWLYNQLRKTIYTFSDQPWGRAEDILLYLAWRHPQRFLFLRVDTLDLECSHPWLFHLFFLSESLLADPKNNCHSKDLLEATNTYGEDSFDRSDLL